VKGAALQVLCKALTLAAAVAALVLLMPSILRQTVSTTHATPANSAERTVQSGMPAQPTAWANDVWGDPSGTDEWHSDGGYWYWLERQPASLVFAP
jgi:hypothetical protein